MRLLLTITFFFLTANLFAQSEKFYKETYRPQFHFTPPIHWMNDPNGLVYHRGEYHLFYQFNPFGNRWGHMSWGHAVSKDLLHWQHLPLAIPEEKDTMIFSGTCVSDINNTAGFAKNPGTVPLIAIYTAHVENVSQSQHLAYSLDDGRTWIKYHHNPVLDIGSKEFRDPQVFWYAPGKAWIMSVVLAIDKKIRFYSSPDLKDWKKLGDFGPVGDTSGIWECPDLFEVPVAGEAGKSKWVLMHSPSPYMQYFVGDFDGTSFINENPGNKIFRPDYGPDYYAAITYKNLPAHSSPVSFGWVNNWNYANDIPTTPWKSAMSLPRQLSVKKINGEWILLQQPIDSVKSMRGKLLTNLGKQNISTEKKLSTAANQYEIDVTVIPSNGAITGLKLASGNDHEVEVGYNSQTKTLYLDRAKSANSSFNNRFGALSRYEVPLLLNNGKLRLHVFVDQSIIEVFANDGEAAITAQFFPGKTDNGVILFSRSGTSSLLSLKQWEIRSIW